MHYRTILVLTLLLVAGPVAQAGSPPGADAVVYRGGDGSSAESAVIIVASTEAVGVNAEYVWIREHFPGSKPKSQSLLNAQGRAYDVMTFIDNAGTERTVYFDISGFFGKY